jgi:hypothetical protein
MVLRLRGGTLNLKWNSNLNFKFKLKGLAGKFEHSKRKRHPQKTFTMDKFVPSPTRIDRPPNLASHSPRPRLSPPPHPHFSAHPP